MPIIKSIFAMLLPIKLPTAIPGWGGFDNTDFKLVVSSGKVVPKAIVQLAIINLETFIFLKREYI